MAEFVRAYPPTEPPAGPARWFVFQESTMLLQQADGVPTLPVGDTAVLQPLMLGEPLFLGTLDGQACMAASIAAEAVLPPGVSAFGLRALFGVLGAEEFAIAGYASELRYWQGASRFCSFCGSPTEPTSGDLGRRCTGCGHTSYPRVSPCVIVLIHDGERVLLTHKPGWGAMYSIVAGFVEPHESLEACLIREVREEVGVEVDELRYVGSQPWPFPHQLMVGFFARYVGGDVRPDTSELDEAAWFHADALPPIPPPISIARRMIDSWVDSVRPPP